MQYIQGDAQTWYSPLGDLILPTQPLPFPLQAPLQLPPGKVYTHLAIAPGSKIVAAAYEGRIHLISMANGDLIESIDAHDGPITALAWCPKIRKAPVAPGSGSGAGAPLLGVLASSSRDKRVRLWGWKMDM